MLQLDKVCDRLLLSGWDNFVWSRAILLQDSKVIVSESTAIFHMLNFVLQSIA